MHTVKAIYPGTFDPLTNGHLDLIARGSKIVDELVVAILRNSEKGTPLFTVPEREEMITEATRSFGNVSVTTFNGLLVDFAEVLDPERKSFDVRQFWRTAIGRASGESRHLGLLSLSPVFLCLLNYLFDGRYQVLWADFQ